jgi:hypothetical protein
VDPTTGALSYAGQVQMGLNAQAIIPGFAGKGDANVRLFVPAIGGLQQNGASNGTASNIMSVSAFADWVKGDPNVITHVTGVNATGAPDYFDIRALAVSTRVDGSAVFYILTACYTTAGTGFDYRIYKSTLAGILGEDETPLDELSPSVAAIVDEGRVYGTSYSGIYFIDLLMQNADDAGGERLMVFLGSDLMICGAQDYKARALSFGLGSADGQIGGQNINSVVNLSETIRQFEKGQSLKRGVKAIKAPAPAAAVSGEETEEEDK